MVSRNIDILHCFCEGDYTGSPQGKLICFRFSQDFQSKASSIHTPGSTGEGSNWVCAAHPHKCSDLHNMGSDLPKSGGVCRAERKECKSCWLLGSLMWTTFDTPSQGGLCTRKSFGQGSDHCSLLGWPGWGLGLEQPEGFKESEMFQVPCHRLWSPGENTQK